jgi:hypothetical protein
MEHVHLHDLLTARGRSWFRFVTRILFVKKSHYIKHATLVQTGIGLGMQSKQFFPPTLSYMAALALHA